ncbi:MAG TPA: tripartite tricarboxylate transporter substrate binding protein [Dongiaceae bacterium]|nr:tripartite tricarboxylate transporter substrate binding protein [Dongiaceae bacterium]
MNAPLLRKLATAVALTAGLTASSGAFAIDDLKIIAPAKPGGGWDQTARSMQEVMQSAGIAKSVTVENVAGAGGIVGLSQLADKEKGNGKTLMVNGLVMVGAILTNQSVVTLEQTTPIARLTGEYEVIVVPKSSDIQNLGQLVEKLKADPGSVAWGGGSAGGTDHILAGLIAQAVGADPTKINYVPFSGGGEALAAILGGHVTAGISGLSEWVGQIQSGDLRALAISSPEKLEGVDIPTLKEQGVDVDLANWRAVVAPPGIDDAQKKALLDAVDTMVKSDGWKKVLADKDWMDLYMSGDEFSKYLADENARVTDILKKLGLVT